MMPARGYGYVPRIEALGGARMLQSTNRTPNGLTRSGAGMTGSGPTCEIFFIEGYAAAAYASLASGR